jgi:PAS domain S-box-containing protein
MEMDVDDIEKTETILRAELAALRRKMTELEANSKEGWISNENQDLLAVLLDRGLVLDVMSELVAFQDLQMRILWANMAAGRSVGSVPDELVGRTCYEVWHQRSEPCENCPVVKSRETGTPQKGEVVSPDGRVWQIQGYPLKNADGEILAIAEVTLEITKNRHAEAALRESEAKYRTLVENIQDVIYSMDTTGVITYISPAVEAATGYEPSEIVGRHFLDFIAAEDWPRIKENIQKILAGARPGPHDYRLVTKTGQIRWMRASSQVAKANHHIVGLKGVLSDITERKQAETVMHESEERLRLLFDNLTIGVYRTTPDGRILVANPALIKLLGCRSFGELARRNLEREGFHPSYPRSEFKARLERDGEIRGFESSWKREDGSIVYIRESARAIQGVDGATLYYEGTVEDISERIRTEEALRESEERYRDLVENINEVIYSIDTQGVLTYVSPVTESLTGYKAPELTGHNIADLIHPEDRQYVVERLQRILQGESQQSSEFRILTKWGGASWVQTSSRPIVHDGQILGVQGVLVSIAERKKVEEALRENEERLRILFDNLTIGVYSTTPEGRILAANPAFIQMLGYSTFDELRARNLDDEAVYRSYPRDEFKGLMERNGEIRGLEVAWRKRDGSIIFVRENARAVRDKRGKIRYYEGTAEDITERMQAEEALRKSEEGYRTLIEQQREGVIIADPNEQFIFCNPAAEEIFGVLRGSLVGRNFKEFVSPETMEQIRQQTRKRREGQKNTYDIEIIRPSGEKRQIVILATPWLDEKGHFAGAWGIFRDETERKRAEMELRFRVELENLISTISTDFINLDFSEIDNGIHRALEKIGEFTGADRSYVFMLSEDRTSADNTHEWCAEGVEPQIDHLKRMASDAFPWWAKKMLAFEDIFIPCVEDLPEEAASEKAMLEAQDIKSLVVIPLVYRESLIGFVGFDFVRAAKAWTYDVEASLRILRMAGNAIANALEHKRTEQALRESESQYRSLIENSNDAIYLLAGNRFEIINRRFSEMFGVSPEEVRRPSFNFLQMVAPRSRPLIEERQRMAQRGETPPPRYEFTALTKDGKELEVETSVSRIPYRGEMATQGILRDVTERKRLEIQLRQAQKMEAIGTLAGGIAHDFNNILMAMLGYAEMAKIDLHEDSTAFTDLEEVLKAGRRAKDLVWQILAFSRQIERERKPVTLHPVIKEALKLLRASLPSTIEIRKEIDTNCGSVLADPTQIHQVLMNLCSNAHHAMREKGGVLGVELRAVEVDADMARAVPNLHEGRYVRLTVSDTGYGMDRSTMERIFEPFFTTKGVGEGTGMGLATVHGIVTSHGGAITVYSEPSKGSTFRVYLPRLETEDRAARSQEEPIPRGEERILFVDDEEPLARLGKQMLERLGYDVTVRTSSIEALEAFRANPHRFDLVIADQTMPNMTGIELADEMMRIRPDIPVVLATGFSETVSPERAKQIGIREYVMKPVATRELAELTRRILDEQKQEA